ncbi:DUF3800 domain-containing protein [Neptunomonas sp.]|uniref:DUF3800 domain-containing protein n=1 Tax=Neptunomonas sp. TaxID=1971898 RepID=UPI0025F5A683|nr:DUF3800 domain-containing protein [Neptunomonas sp.]
MYFYVDESGQTGLNLFDESQPFLYYGVLISRFNLDILAEKDLKPLRKKLDVERLHASELGNGRLVEISKDINKIKRKYNLSFDFHRIAKADHALISFFDQVFDQGLNPAVPWDAYWTPLKYMLLGKVAYLFDDETLKKAWKARITVNNAQANKLLIEVCEVILGRVSYLPDARSQEIITDGLSWVVKNVEAISYNIDTKKDGLQISPNLIGFQSVMHGIASRLEKEKTEASKVIVDRQSEFNAAQEHITKFYQEARDIPWVSGPGLPVMNLTHIPKVPITCTAGTESAGLEIVDIFIWIFKRNMENKPLANELVPIINGQLRRGRYDEVSINALMDRWGKWFQNLPEPSEESLEKARKMIADQEVIRKTHVKN